MREILYLLKKIRKYDPKMFLMILLFTIFGALYPFIWVLVPSHLLTLPVGTPISQLAIVLTVAAVLAVVGAFLMAFFRGNYRMRMNNVRYYLLRDCMRYSFAMPYEDTLDKDKLEKLSKANISVIGPMHGGGGLMLAMLGFPSQVVAFLGFAALFVTLEWWILLMALATIAATFLIKLKLFRNEFEVREEVTELNRKELLLNTESTNPAWQKDFQVYSLYSLVKAYIQSYIDEINALLQSVLKKQVRGEAVIAVLNFFRDTVIYVYLIFAFRAGQIDLGGFYLYSTSLISMITLAQTISAEVNQMDFYRKQFKHFVDIDQELNSFQEETDAGFGQSQAKAVQVRLEGVSFRYPNQEHNVIKNLSLEIKAGEKLALVGENGSGKSTLIKLICRLYRPKSGRILFDGVDIWEMSEEEFRQKVSVVFQDAAILPFSIEENVTMAVHTDPDAFDQAMNQSGLADIVAKLPEKEQTYLLRILADDGLDLSGGQRQKLLLARALYRQSSGLLLLDEPTAALDPLAEQALYENYNELTSGKTSMFISHRLASTQFCDRIVFLDNGQIVEEGTHASLLAAKGVYYDLYEVQAKNYRNAGKEDA